MVVGAFVRLLPLNGPSKGVMGIEARSAKWWLTAIAIFVIVIAVIIFVTLWLWHARDTDEEEKMQRVSPPLGR